MRSVHKKLRSVCPPQNIGMDQAQVAPRLRQASSGLVPLRIVVAKLEAPISLFIMNTRVNNAGSNEFTLQAQMCRIHCTLPTAADAENKINQFNDTIDNIRVVPNPQHLSPGINKRKAQNMSEPATRQ